MSAEPLYVAFIWHMHQPYYKNTLTGDYSLPWVRLHAAKHYLHMAEVLADYPQIHAMFNFTPCLVKQLDEYAAGRAMDRALALSLKDQWTADEKEFLLSFFFSLNWQRIVRRYPRYSQLLELRQQAHGEAGLLSNEYYRDLVAWFNLAWIDPKWLERDEALRSLVEKGKHFSGEDIKLILTKQREIIQRILPLYRELEVSGQVELTTSPYYHPILPLLIDGRSAQRASPGLPLPGLVFARPQDAEEQIRRAVRFHRDRFGSQPRGMWPSEGAVCQEMVPLLAHEGFAWFASDEAVLARSLNTPIERDSYGHVTNPEVLYQPYGLRPGGENQQPVVIFRDHLLSDRIGFVYAQMEEPQAAEDLVSRLHRIREKLSDPENPYLVSIILDGENCWGEYEHSGDIFLRHLYSLLSKDPDLRTVTVSEYLSQHPPRQSLLYLSTGSWIRGDLETWIGEEDQNRAWECLARTREQLVSCMASPSVDPSTSARAWEEIYIAEGSDWFWWYYSRNNPGEENFFDHEFRTHLGNVYRLLGLSVPIWLRRPISLSSEPLGYQPPRAYISPPLTAGASLPVEWAAAGYLEPELSTGTMQQAEALFRRLYYGYDPAHLYLRLETNQDLAPYLVVVYLSSPEADRANRRPRRAGEETIWELPSMGLSWEVAVEGSSGQALLSRAVGQEVWQPVPGGVNIAIDSQVMEIGLTLADLNLGLGGSVGLVLLLIRDGVVVGTLPSSGYLHLNLIAFERGDVHGLEEEDNFS